MILTDEQRKAVDLAAEITKLGGYVVSLVPPGVDDLVLRWQAPTGETDDRIMAALKEWGWRPDRIGTGPRFDPLGGAIQTNSYSVRIPVERTVLAGKK